jgi:hypothetical protein
MAKMKSTVLTDVYNYTRGTKCHRVFLFGIVYQVSKKLISKFQ